MTLSSCALCLCFVSGLPLLISPCCAAGQSTDGIDALVEVLGDVEDPAFQLDVLRGMQEGLRGRKDVTLPTGWTKVSAKLRRSSHAEVREKATLLALVFHEPRAVETLSRLVADRSAKAGQRQRALAALVEVQTPGLARLLHKLLDDAALRGAALRALAVYDDAGTPQAILSRYATFKDGEKIDAVNTLAARASYAIMLLETIEKGGVPRGDLSAYTVRQLQAFADKRIDTKLAKVWGASRQTSKEKAVLMAKYKSFLGPDAVAAADAANGRRVFQRTCASCHRLFGEGGQVGPDLTGSNRKNLDYVLENVLDPSALISRDYRLTLILTEDGRLLSGIVAEQTGKTVTIQTVNQRLIVAKTDIERMQSSDVSMMPEGVLDKLSHDEVRELVAYLKAEKQVPLPGE
jgi:putative heme-binding domain-containing protein